MNDIDLTKILKDCPKGTKLYSTIFGEVEFVRISGENSHPVILKAEDESVINVDSEGKHFSMYEGECTLFPSREQRDWGKFTAPWYKKPKFDPKALNPFEKVLVRDSDNGSWCCDLFSHIKEENINYKYVASSFFCYRCCIPYNEETKHLVGTSEEAPEFYRYWEN